jgi:RNA polymerase sigma-32 factor
MSKNTLLALASAVTILPRQEQIDTVVKYQEAASPTSKKRLLNTLIESNVRLVISIAKKYQRAGLEMEDLVAEGTMGILDAAEKYDNTSAASFSSYAALWIRARVQAYVQSAVTPVRVGSRAARKLYASLPRLHREFGQDITPEKIAEELKLEVSEVVEALPFVGRAGISIDKPIGDDGRSTIADLFADESPNPEQAYAMKEATTRIQAALSNFTGGLNERDAAIFNDRIVADVFNREPVSLIELAESFGVSKQRIAQLEKRIRENLKKHMIAAQV